MLRAILFDFNGVLVDDEPLHLELFQRVLEEEGIELSADDYRARYLGHDDSSCFADLLARAGRPATPDRLSRLIARKSAYYHQRVHADGFPIFPGAAELIAEAVDAGLMLGVVSGALRDEVEAALDQLGAREHFKCLVCAEDVEHGKPDPAGYRRCLEQLNALPPLPSRLVHPHEVLAIEDTPAGLQAAAAAGLSTLAVAHTYPVSDLETADQVAPSLGELDLRQLQKLFADRF